MNRRGVIILFSILVLLAGYFFLVDEAGRNRAEEARRSSKRLLPYGPLDIDAVSFLNPYGKTIQWERKGDGWLITYPVTDIGEKSTIDMFLAQIAPGLKIDEYENVPDLSVYGLSPPFATVILESRRYGRTDTLNVGDTAPTTSRAYVSLGSSRTVYLTRDLARNVMQKKLYHLRDKNFLPPSLRNIDRFSIVTEKGSLSFQRAGDSWRVAGSTITVDRGVVHPWISGLADALVYDFAAENLADTLSFGIGDPERAAVLRTAGGDSVRVSFGRREESLVPAVRTGRDKVMMIESHFLEAFHWTEDRLIVMSLSLVKPGMVSALQWETPDTVLSWKKDGEIWKVAGCDSCVVDQEALKYLLMYLRSVSFENIVTDRELVSGAVPEIIITLGGPGGKVLDIISLYHYGDGTAGGISLSGGNAGRLREGVLAEIRRAFSAFALR